MKWTMAAGLTLMVVYGACETQVKPEGQQSPPPAVAARNRVDQTPDLDEHPRALYHNQEAEPTVATINWQPRIETLLAPTSSGLSAIPPDGFRITVNRYCPIMQKHTLGQFTMVEHTVEFEGQTVGFCCDDCPETWKLMSDEERRAALKAVADKK